MSAPAKTGGKGRARRPPHLLNSSGSGPAASDPGSNSNWAGAAGGQMQGGGHGTLPPRSVVPSNSFTQGRPAGYSSDDSDDDGFDYVAPSSTTKKNASPTTANARPLTSPTPGSKAATCYTGAGTYYFIPTTMDTTDSSTTAGANWRQLRTDSASTGTASATSSRSLTAGLSASAATPVRGRDAFPPIPQLDASVFSTMEGINKAWNNGFPVNRDSCLAYITVALRNVFQNCPNPYTAGLYIFGNCGDFFACKPWTLSLHVMAELKKWLLDHGLTDLEKSHLSKEIQLTSFDIVTRQRNTPILKLVCEIYRLDQVRSDLVHPIRELCARGLYKEGCHVATFLGMHTQFDIHDFVIPLLLQDREFVAAEYLSGSKEKQTDLISFLDDMFDDKKNSLQALHEYVNTREINSVKLEKMQSKALVKLVTRLVEKFKADPVHCPNFSRKKRSGALRHLAYRKYDERTMLNDACFEELVDSTVLEDPVLQDEIVYLMRANNDLNLAARFALRHALPLDRVPSDIQREMHKINPNVIPPVVELEEEEDWETEPSQTKPPKAKAKSPAPKASMVKDPSVSKPSKSVTIASSERTRDEFFQNNDERDESHAGASVSATTEPKPDYHIISVPKQNVHYMDTPFGVQSFLKDLAGAFAVQKRNGGRQDFIIVSIDAEWKPMMFEKGGVALIQVGLADEVYLIDTFALKLFKQDKNDKLFYPFWEELRDQFFANERVVKIGYALDGDIKMFANTCVQWQNVREHFKNFLDLSKVHRDLVRLNENFFPYSKSGNPGNTTGLSELVRASFGKPLSKEEQFSNWENRPLREAQIKYATADAYILMELFQFMNKRSGELNIDLEEIVLNLLNTPKSTSLPKKKKSNATSVVHSVSKTRRVVPIDSPYVTTQLAAEMKFVCDNMVQGLGKQLRSCGIDTIILENEEEHDRCIHYASREERAILTRGSVYNHLARSFPDFRYFNVTVDKLEEQLNEVLSYFNISVCEADLFSRCQKCNSGTFISVSRKTMDYMLMNRNRVLRQTNFIPDPDSNVDYLIGEITLPMENGQIIKKWNLLSENVINISDLKNIRTGEGATIIFDKITPGHLENIETFIICNSCGKIYWDGSHLQRVKEGKSVLPVPKENPGSNSPRRHPPLNEPIYPRGRGPSKSPSGAKRDMKD